MQRKGSLKSSLVESVKCASTDLAQASASNMNVMSVDQSPTTNELGLFYKHIFLWMNTESIPFAQKDFKGMKGKSFFHVFCNCFYQHLTLSYLHFQLVGSFLTAIKDTFRQTLKARPD